MAAEMEKCLLTGQAGHSVFGGCWIDVNFYRGAPPVHYGYWLSFMCQRLSESP